MFKKIVGCTLNINNKAKKMIKGMYHSRNIAYESHYWIIKYRKETYKVSLSVSKNVDEELPDYELEGDL